MFIEKAYKWIFKIISHLVIAVQTLPCVYMSNLSVILFPCVFHMTVFVCKHQKQIK
uniref:Uncharacterized protein n=1 Tax=Dolomedes mizhoanus TaxID=1366394 RepID=S5MJX9_9ARAC|nr:hypothetical protein [Dolomedes mizhoanus]